MATITPCDSCNGSGNPSTGNLNSTYETTVTAFISNDHFCVTFQNSTEWDSNVTLWLEDSYRRGALSGSETVNVPPMSSASRCASGLGYLDDQVTPLDQLIVHMALEPNGPASVGYAVHQN